MNKLNFTEHFGDLSVAFAMFVVVFLMALFFTKKGGPEPKEPERAGAPGAPKKNSQLPEFRLKAKKVRERERSDAPTKRKNHKRPYRGKPGGGYISLVGLILNRNLEPRLQFGLIRLDLSIRCRQSTS